MKKIEAYLKPFRVAEVRNALAEAGFGVLRVLKAEELRPSDTYTEVVQGMEYEIDVVPRALLVLLVDDDRVDDVVRLIQSCGKTDHDGDGRILISTIERSCSVDPAESPPADAADAPVETES